MPIRAFTIPIRVFTMRRSWRSRCADPRVHDRAVPALVDGDGGGGFEREPANCSTTSAVTAPSDVRVDPEDVTSFQRRRTGGSHNTQSATSTRIATKS